MVASFHKEDGRRERGGEEGARIARQKSLKRVYYDFFRATIESSTREKYTGESKTMYADFPVLCFLPFFFFFYICNSFQKNFFLIIFFPTSKNYLAILSHEIKNFYSHFLQS